MEIPVEKLLESMRERWAVDVVMIVFDEGEEGRNFDLHVFFLQKLREVA
jgi:hypothetical protein